MELLCNKFPKCFFLHQVNRKPLKVGIHKDVEVALNGLVEPKILKWVLGDYVVNGGYLRSVKAGSDRVDLDGNPSGVVTVADAGYAARGIRIIKTKQTLTRSKKEREKPRPKPKPTPKRDGLDALKEAARKRKAAQSSQDERAV